VLILKIEERVASRGIQTSPEAGKGKGAGSPLEPPRGISSAIL
jgi:hypothetical protein